MCSPSSDEILRAHVQSYNLPHEWKETHLDNVTLDKFRVKHRELSPFESNANIPSCCSSYCTKSANIILCTI